MSSWLKSLRTPSFLLRSSVIGRNVTIVTVDGEMDLGEFGRIHFIDWDQTRGRTRTVQIMIIGE